MKKNEEKVDFSIIDEPIERIIHQLVLEYIKLLKIDGSNIDTDDALKIFNIDNEELDETLDALHDMGYIKRDFITQEVELL